MENTIKKSRTVYAAQNFIWSTIGNLSSSLLGFISRTVFIYTLGTVYLGINGLFTNLIGMLSLAELGVGTAISFSLYKPLAENDIKKIQAIINFYRSAYRIIACIIAVIGISLVPFLNHIVKGVEGIQDLQLIYCIFLFNTVTSYLITYKTTLLIADQRNYLITNINTVINIITTIVQIIVLLVFKNFIVYLIVGAVIQLISKLYLNYFTDKQYPYIKGKNKEKLSEDDKNIIYKKIKALIMHKIGEVSIYQTDNIITSAFINVNTVGLVSNFTMIINIINGFIMSFFNSATAGLGNIIATESKEKRLEVAQTYDFLGFVFFGCSTICLYFLLTPFITIWIGPDKLVDKITVSLLCINYYLTGMRVPLGNIKNAAGVYEKDKWLPIIQSILNIVISIIGAKHLGLKGIYIGTLISSMVPNIIRPYIVYKNVLFVSCKSYFKQYLLRIMGIIGCICGLELVFNILNFNNKLIEFITMMLISSIIPIALIIIIFRNSYEFKYIRNVIISMLKKIPK